MEETQADQAVDCGMDGTLWASKSCLCGGLRDKEWSTSGGGGRSHSRPCGVNRESRRPARCGLHVTPRLRWPANPRLRRISGGSACQNYSVKAPALRKIPTSAKPRRPDRCPSYRSFLAKGSIALRTGTRIEPQPREHTAHHNGRELRSQRQWTGAGKRPQPPRRGACRVRGV